MRYLRYTIVPALALLLAASSALASNVQPARPADLVSGKWNLALVYGYSGGTDLGSMTLVQKGSAVTGKITLHGKSHWGTTSVTGIVAGTAITLSYGTGMFGAIVYARGMTMMTGVVGTACGEDCLPVYSFAATKDRL